MTTTTLPRRVRVQGDLFHGRIPAGAIYIGRAAPGLPKSPFHNPFRVGKTPGCDTPQDAVDMYDGLLTFGAAEVVRYPQPGELGRLNTLREDVLARIEAGELDGRDVACWCGELSPCHGDPLLQAVQEIRSRPVHLGGVR